MQTITHEGKTYSKHPATNLCFGCDFWHIFGNHHECHAPASARCSESIYKEITEEENYVDAYDFQNQLISKEDLATIIKFILTVLFILAFTIGSLATIAYIIINNYK